jgi:hypothetical protein
MTAAEQVRDLLASILGPAWRLQYGRWTDKPGAKTDRFAVLRPAGGGPAELVRRPFFTLMLIGQDGGDITEAAAAADAVVQAMRSNSGGLVFLQPAEPAFVATDDNRPVFEIALTAITT